MRKILTVIAAGAVAAIVAVASAATGPKATGDVGWHSGATYVIHAIFSAQPTTNGAYTAGADATPGNAKGQVAIWVYASDGTTLDFAYTGEVTCYHQNTTGGGATFAGSITSFTWGSATPDSRTKNFEFDVIDNGQGVNMPADQIATNRYTATDSNPALSSTCGPTLDYKTIDTGNLQVHQ